MRALAALALGLAACAAAPTPEADYAQALATRDPKQALALLDRAIAAKPQPDYHAARARLHVARQDPQAALADLDAALALTPGDALAAGSRLRLLLVRAQLHRQLGRAPEAEADLDQVLALEPEHTEACLERAWLRRRTGRAALAARDVETARKAGIAAADLYYNAAVRAVNVGDGPEAERMIGFALDIDPGHSLARIARARLFMEQRRFDEAAAELDGPIRVWPKDAELYYHRGTALLAAGKAEAALEDFTKAVDLAPREAPYLAGRGLAKYRAGRDVAAARADFEAAITADPKCYAGWFNRGVVAHERRELEQAEKDLRRATSIRATPEGSIALGRVFHDRGDYDTALDLYRQALEIYRSPEAQKALRDEAERTRRAKETNP